MYWALTGDARNHPDALLQEADPAALAVFRRVPAHAGVERLCSADDFAPDSLAFLDLVQTLSGPPVVTEAFRRFAEARFPGALAFAPCLVRWGGRDVLEWVGPEVGAFHSVEARHRARVVNRDLEPVRFWPHLKRFKAESYVIDRRAEHPVFADEGLARALIVDARFKEAAESAGLRVSFRPLPCAPWLAEP